VSGEGASRPERRLVDLVARRLGWAATNLGVGGSSSTDVADLIARKPPPPSRMYLVMTGLNDAHLHGAYTAALPSFATALQAIFAALGDANPAALAVTVEQPHLLEYSWHAPHDRGSDQILDAYNDRLRAVASEFSRVVVAQVAGWDPSTMLDADTVHPSDAGHAAIAGAVVAAAGR